MGTNYYLKNLCNHCGHYEETHLCKLSYGWPVAFRGQQDVTTKEEMERFVTDTPGEVYDEYGQWLDREEFWDLIERHQKSNKHAGDYSFHFHDFS